jgi:hypothetical protein
VSDLPLIPSGGEITPTESVVDRIRKLHDFAAFFGTNTLLAMAECGRLLIEQKRKLHHGEWERWVKKNLNFSPRTATRYMKISRNRQKVIEEDKAKSLTQAYSILADSTVKKGTILADKKRMIRDLVSPIRVVRRRLKHLPWSPLHKQELEEVHLMLITELADLLREMG